ncbi:SDR family oxidoreductase [uncultured Muriicola sp.]|uniref:SDR family oxidoreductase n=1 Tax=uncultured Muriicola sp. TaxID=1583102 RepID=UPI00260D672E|nr:SDR family oxidoreductase [uncultured Muriicola sp.]
MSENSTKQWALILGGSRGLGLATAQKLAKHGYAICIVHRDRRTDMESINNSFSQIKVDASDFYALNADAINSEKRQEVLKHMGEMMEEGDTIKMLVHSIAKGSMKPMVSDPSLRLTAQDIEITSKSMAVSLYEWVQDILNSKLNDSDMRVISFTSEGNSKVIPGYAAVSVAKVALEAITRNMALEMAPLGVKANCIQAGVTETASFAMIPNSDIIKENALKRNPSGRLTTPQDVANTVYLLSLEEAKWITGTIIKADGGESLR